MPNEIHDLIQTCDLLPSEDTIRRLLDICEKLNAKVEALEAGRLTKVCPICCAPAINAGLAKAGELCHACYMESKGLSRFTPPANPPPSA